MFGRQFFLQADFKASVHRKHQTALAADQMVVMRALFVLDQLESSDAIAEIDPPHETRLLHDFDRPKIGRAHV